ncbi:response regulator [Alkalinema sp. FACHB-956]|uniref:response regulator n=1 Tax=Alkalinema sp. FACHB-956 TaxID=2692768 RepID=UPI001681CE2C|nr:response regulator [Alkalinema sp. FACHB-956]MBD2330040.1 response regulator [Alkalinema sp. FACHB-956]
MGAKRILVVDNESYVREVTQISLQMMAGWEVTTAGSGQEALEKAAIESPDAILLDLMMPDMDGMTTLQHLQSQPETSHIPVIFMTGQANQPTDYADPDLAVTGFVSKPFDPLQLANQIANILSWDLDSPSA